MRGALAHSAGVPDRCALLYHALVRADARRGVKEDAEARAQHQVFGNLERHPQARRKIVIVRIMWEFLLSARVTTSRQNLFEKIVIQKF